MDVFLDRSVEESLAVVDFLRVKVMEHAIHGIGIIVIHVGHRKDETLSVLGSVWLHCHLRRGTSYGKNAFMHIPNSTFASDLEVRERARREETEGG